jgi:hypothetical protein
LNNTVNIELFIRTMSAGNFSPDTTERASMFLFNRSVLAVCLALVVAALPVLIQYL